MTYNFRNLIFEGGGVKGIAYLGAIDVLSQKGIMAAGSNGLAAPPPAGILAVWSASPEPAFSRLLRQSGFAVEEVTARARGRKGGSRHLIWLAERT